MIEVISILLILTIEMERRMKRNNLIEESTDRFYTERYETYHNYMVGLYDRKFDDTMVGNYPNSWTADSWCEWLNSNSRLISSFDCNTIKDFLCFEHKYNRDESKWYDCNKYPIHTLSQAKRLFLNSKNENKEKEKRYRKSFAEGTENS